MNSLIFSPLNLIPKAGNPGKYHLIHNLAFPYDSNSINGNIPDSQDVVTYAPFDQAVCICLALGPGCRISKMDYDSTFRIFPISGQDLHLLGFTLGEDYFINSSMAFEARSSCRIFETFATAMDWSFQRKTNWPFITHYLDDFFFAHGNYVGCATLMHTFKELCSFVGSPLSPDKPVSPTMCLTFLGLTFHMINQVVTIPSEKIGEAIILIEFSWHLIHEK